MATTSGSNADLEEKLWKTAEKLRGPVDPSEYKDFALGLLFLKSMSDSFGVRRKELEKKTRDQNSRYYTEDEKEREYILTDKDEYTRENVFYIPEEARWEYLVNNATDPQIGQKIDEAMRIVEEENPRLKGMLPKDFSRSTLPHDSLEGLINLFADLEMNEIDDDGEKKEDEDIFGRVYEYFIKNFAMEGGQKGGEFYTPKSVVELLVEILEPYEGRIFDPFCGSGGMFVQSHKFLRSRDENTDQISIYGQEIKKPTLQICKMNLFLRGLDGDIRLGDSIRDDQHKGRDMDYIITNPPFNESEWGRDSIADDDPRFQYGLPPASKQGGNYAFLQHMIYHLKDGGLAGTVMSNGALSVRGTEADIRKRIVKDDLLDAVISLPTQLFFTTEIPVSLLILSKGKGKYTDNQRERANETLFVDARDMYVQVEKKQKILSENNIQKIANTVRLYRGEEESESYEDVPGYCSIGTLEDIQAHNFVIAPGRYVGIDPNSEIDEIQYEVEMERLSSSLRGELEKESQLRDQIESSLEEVGF